MRRRLIELELMPARGAGPTPSLHRVSCRGAAAPVNVCVLPGAVCSLPDGLREIRSRSSRGRVGSLQCTLRVEQSSSAGGACGQESQGQKTLSECLTQSLEHFSEVDGDVDMKPAKGAGCEKHRHQAWRPCTTCGPHEANRS